jgi:hypothetical protein
MDEETDTTVEYGSDDESDPSSSTDRDTAGGSTTATGRRESDPIRASRTGSSGFVDGRQGKFTGNALIGALVTIVTSFLGVSPLFGGLTAGYLQAGSRTDGAKVGAVSGLIAAIPGLAVLAGFFLLFGVATLGALTDPLGAGLVLWLLITVVAAGTAAFSGGLGAVGGYVGAAVRDDGQSDRVGRPPDTH